MCDIWWQDDVYRNTSAGIHWFFCKRSSKVIVTSLNFFRELNVSVLFFIVCGVNVSSSERKRRNVAFVLGKRMDNFYFLIAIVLLLIARLLKKMCEYFKLALNIVKTKFDQTTRLESWIFFNSKNFENQKNSMLCKRLNDNKRAILAFFLSSESFLKIPSVSHAVPS